MRHRATFWVTLAAGVVLAAGCEQTAVKQVRVSPPAPAPQPQQPPQVVREALPSSTRAVEFVSLQADPRPAIDILLENVQKSYEAGQKEYQAGNSDAAKADFERGVNLIVSSGFRVDFDPHLSRLFDEIGEAMHSYELDETQTTEEEEAETPSNPAPIDEIADLTLPPGDPRLARAAQDELIRVPHDLPLTVNPSVLQYLSFFTTPHGREIVQRGLSRAARYSGMIRSVLKQEGVPADLIYLAQAESAFLPDAVSRAGARGIWQFMPFRGEEYELDRSYWIDERSDPEKATHAAAEHLRDLYDMFGDWYLAMAAYNSGPLNVSRAIERTGYADFWQLERLRALPKQTENYVPIIIALALVAKDPAMYGIQVDPQKPEPFETIKPGQPISLELVADATGTDVDTLRDMNPELLRNVTPNDSQFELKIPEGCAQKFQQNIQQVPDDKWTSWRLHEVTDGETLREVAQTYHVTLAALEDVNHLEAGTTLADGFWLTVPTAPPRARLVHYRVRRTESLESIAIRFDVTVPELKRWNHIRSNYVRRGARLRIYAGGEPLRSTRPKSRTAIRDVSATSASHAPTRGDAVRHTVKRGETLYSIAHQYGTTVAALRESNPFLAERELETGDVLTIQQ
jgi:membrane-bound lytic murein transglycosylase D